MAFKVFLDANVTLDFLLQRNGYADAEMIVSSALERKTKLFLTPAIVHITAYWLRKKHDTETVKNILLTFLNDVQCIDMKHEMVIQSLQSNFTDVEDALQYYTAIYHQLDCFITRDKNFIKSAKPQLPVYHPADFIKKYIA